MSKEPLDPRVRKEWLDLLERLDRKVPLVRSDLQALWEHLGLSDLWDQLDRREPRE